MNIKKYAALGATVALMSVPMLASAQAVTASTSVGVSADIQAQVQTLLSQIKALQDQLKNLLTSAGSSTSAWVGHGENGDNHGQQGKQACITLNRTLGVGAQGDDVKQIQQLLSDDHDADFHGSITGFFGPLTAKAFAKFQVNNGIASSSDGTAGPRTRAFFERRCGKGLGEHGNDQAGGPGQNGQGDDDHGGRPAGDRNAFFIAGTITAASASSITIQGPNNDSKTFAITASTTIEVGASSSTPAHAGTAADLVVGAKAQVQATGNASSSTATHIRIGDFVGPQGGPNGPGQGGGLLTKDLWEKLQQGLGGDDHGHPQGGPQNY